MSYSEKRKTGKEKKQILCLLIFKGRGLNSTALETLNLASLLNIQVVISKQLNFSSLEFNLKTNAETFTKQWSRRHRVV